MQSFTVNFKRAVFGWPFYTAWNLTDYALERRGRERALRFVAALLFWAFTTGAWVSFWVAVFWLLLRSIGLT